jgi:hypothetical protein
VASQGEAGVFAGKDDHQVARCASLDPPVDNGQSLGALVVALFSTFFAPFVAAFSAALVAPVNPVDVPYVAFFAAAPQLPPTLAIAHHPRLTPQLHFG